jgi:hypothetical protein
LSGTTLTYVNSPGYACDLRAARTVWGSARVVAGAGMFIFATYATLPPLVSVGSAGEEGEALMLRKVVGEERTLTRLLGIGDGIDEAGGLANPGFRRVLAALGERHRGLRGMTGEYLDLFAGIVAISAVRIRASMGLTLDSTVYHRYWRYMRHSLALLGARLDSQRVVSESCAGFVARYTGAGPRTRDYLTHLFTTHPEHMVACGDALFPDTRRVVVRTMGGWAG